VDNEGYSPQLTWKSWIASRSWPQKFDPSRIDERNVVSDKLFDLAGIAAVRGGTADRVGGVNADREVDVSALGIERIIAG
jgi:hypothetical protein